MIKYKAKRRKTMIFFTKEFPPCVDTQMRVGTSSATYSFRWNGNEVASIDFALNQDSSIQIRTLSKNENANRYYPNEHVCTELFNFMLLDVYQKWNIIPSRIAGTLSCSDAHNHNWITSIPFYAHFPHHLVNKIPYNVNYSDTK
jgi:hypothetical protein